MSFSGRPPPSPQDVFVVPVSYLTALRTVARKMKGSDAFWSVTGDLAENLQGVHVRPKEVEVVTEGARLQEMLGRLSEYRPTEPAPTERRLERDAEIGGKSLPVLSKSVSAGLTVEGVPVLIHGDYRLKVGDWEWGDAVVFDPIVMNVAGVPLPVMPLRIASEIYLTLGWVDRVEKISDAVARAHHALHQQSGGEPVY